MNTVIYFFITKPGFQEKCDDDEKSGLRPLCALHTCLYVPVKVAKCLNTSFLTVLTKQSMVPLNKGSSPGFGRGVV